MRRVTALFMLFFVTISVSPALCQVVFKQLVDNGPREKRINFVMLADGYTSAEQNKFDADAAVLQSYLLSFSPFSDYAEYYNVFTIYVPSVESGSDHPFSGIYRNTYFSSSFDCYGIQRLVTIPPNDWDPDYSHGAGKVYSLLGTWLPEYDIIAVIVNDPEYGGSGGDIAVLSNHSAAPEVVVHELGHTLAGLGDEYEDAYPGYPDIEEPNTTQQTVRELIKWNPWILPSTPIPTPENSGYSGVVGLFEGAHYHTTGWYRPRLNCEMRSLYQQFCDICKEQLILAKYARVAPIQGFSPTAPALTMTTVESQNLGVTTMMPNGLPLSCQWHLDSIPIPGATDTSLVAIGYQLGLGTHRIQAKVWDNSSSVRMDPQGLLDEWHGWTVTVTGCCRDRTGNIDGDIDDLTDISDLTALVEYLFNSGTISPCDPENDIDGSSAIDISDLTLLVDYLFFAVPLPVCPLP
ncbi:MAG: M64 family metallopeptidase [Candidatus Zixiibacteriota bacterium]